MKKVLYTDEWGMKRWVGLPDNAPDSQAEYGIPLTIDLSGLGLSKEKESLLHQKLWEQGLETLQDYKNPQVLTQTRRAIQMFYRYEVSQLVALANEQNEDEDSNNGNQRTINNQ